MIRFQNSDAVLQSSAQDDLSGGEALAIILSISIKCKTSALLLLVCSIALSGGKKRLSGG